MLEKTAKAISTFTEALCSDPRFMAMKEAEKTMVADFDFQRLCAIKDRKNEVYNEKIKWFGESSPEAKEAGKELYLAKKELDTLPVVMEYQNHFAPLGLLMVEIDATVFGPYRQKAKRGGNHD